VEENSEEKEFAKGLPGMNLGVGWETRGDSRRYNFRGEGSDKDFSLQSQTRRGKLSRNTSKIQETGNL
jgi:hypothetical protein